MVKDHIPTSTIQGSSGLKDLPLKPGIMGLSPNQVTTMFLHDTSPGWFQETDLKVIKMLQELVSQSSLNKYMYI
jgi:hypothetical protein